MAPINKKPGAGPAGKSGAGILGKSSSGKPSSGSAPKILGSSSGGKSTFGASTSKSYPSSTYSIPKSSKPSASFSIIWLPTKKRNKKKEAVYTSHNYDNSKGAFDRAPSMYKFMSGDSSEYPHKKKEEEADLLVPERNKAPIATVATAGTALATVEPPTDSSGTSNAEEKQGFIQYDKEDNKQAAGDRNDKDFKNDKDDEYLENDKGKNKSENQDKVKTGDNVDSVYLRPPPAHKTRSNTSTVEEEDCGIKCLYYTLQCCDCVLM